MDDVTALRELHDFLWDEMEFFNDEADPDHQWTTHALGQKHDDLVERFHDAYPSLLAAAEARAIEGSGVVRTVQAKRPPSGVDSHMAGWVRWDKPMDPITRLLANLDYESYEVDAVGGGKVRCWKFSEWPDTLRRAVETVRAALPHPEKPRVERCAFEYETAEGMTTCGRVHDNPYHRHDPESPPHRPDGMCHPYTPEAR